MHKDILNISILLLIFNFILFFFFKVFYLNYLFPILIISFSIFTLIFMSKGIRKFILENWLKFGKLISRFLNPIIFGIIYFLIITPYSYLLSIFKKDFFDYTINPSKSSYWINKKQEYKKSLKDQF